MHQSFTQEQIAARYTFIPERAAEFLEDGQTVTQIECDSLDEVLDYAREFEDALENAIALVGSKVVCLTGEVYDTVKEEDIFRVLSREEIDRIISEGDE